MVEFFGSNTQILGDARAALILPVIFSTRGRPLASANFSRHVFRLAMVVSSLVVFGGRVGSHAALFEATRRIVERNEFCRPRLAPSALGAKASLSGAIWLALASAESKILPSALDASRIPSPGQGLSLLPAFLALPQLQ